MKGSQHHEVFDYQPPAAGLHAFFPGAFAVLIGLIASSMLVYLALSGNSQGPSAEQTLARSQAASVGLALKQMNAETRAAAQDSGLVQALKSGDPAAIAQTQGQLHARDGLLGVRLSPLGIDIDTQGSLPVSFTTLDMLNKAAQGEDALPEARKVGERWMLYSAAPVRATPTAPVSGTLLFAFDPQRLVNAVPPMPEAMGRVRLIQQFGSGPEQVFLDRGQSAGGKPQSLDTGFASWKLEFSAGPALNNPTPWLFLALAALVALAGALLGLYLNERALQRRICADVRQLDQLLEELSSGKAVKPFGLGLPVLDRLAQQLARFSQIGRAHV